MESTLFVQVSTSVDPVTVEIVEVSFASNHSVIFVKTESSVVFVKTESLASNHRLRLLNLTGNDGTLIILWVRLKSELIETI